MISAHVVTSFLYYEGRICILRRSQKVGTYQGRWAGVSGYLEDEPLAQALTEIREEVGLSEEDVELLNRADPIEVIDVENDRNWLVHPFLFRIADPERIRMDWEHTELKWILPEEMSEFPTVPNLQKVFDAVWKNR